MKFLARLAAGQITLWRTFWLIGTPLALVWDITGAGMVLGIGVGEAFLAGFIIALFALASLAMPFVSLALWRSASNYPRRAWWHTLFAIAAKFCAVFSGLAAGLSVLGLLYLAYDFIAAGFA